MFVKKITLAYANRHSSPPYLWALALHTLEEGVIWREMIKNTLADSPALVDSMRKDRPDFYWSTFFPLSVLVI